MLEDKDERDRNRESDAGAAETDNRIHQGFMVHKQSRRNPN